MKKLLLTIIVFTGIFQFTQAQEVGVRFGDAIGGHYAVDAVFGLTGFNRIHADLSFGNDGVGVEALYDFYTQKLGQGFGWYVGAGPTAFLGDPFILGVSGEIGLEYHFNIPLAIGVDWRPTFIIVENTDFEAGWFGLNVRYVFGK